MNSITFRRAILALVIPGVISACNESVAPMDLAGPGISFTIAGGDAQIGAVGDSLPQLLSVVVKDDSGRTVPGYAVSWSATAGSLSAPADTTDDAGVAGVALTLPSTPDTVEITAKVEGFPALVFHAVATAAMAMESGDVQVGAVGAALALPLTIIMTDYAGNPVPGYAVAWEASAGTITPLAPVTDAAGKAQATLTLPSEPITVAVTATAEGMPAVSFSAAATPTGAPLVFRYVEVGSYHACGITTTEKSICWGFNEDGQVGTGALSTIAPLTRVSTDRTVRMTSAGRYHSCEITLSGDVWCGGSNTGGQVNGNPSPPVTPFARVQPLPATAFRVVQAGLLHSCALSLSKQIWCWGANGEGQLGTGPSTPVPGSFSVPAFVADEFDAVTTTGLHTCALTTSGQAECWGLNESGQLGDGTTTTRGVPAPISGTFIFRTEPAVVPAAPDPDFYIPGQSFISAGFAHTCGILTSNAAVCWGVNEDGQLGNGSSGIGNRSLTPVSVSGGFQFKAISAGYRHTCAITTAGAAYCWGDNALGQLGDGTTTDRFTPRAVSGGLTFMSISAGDTFSCGVTTAGVAYCWGDNEYGQLGSVAVAGSTVPVELPFQ
jgi:alpha-tubulin suppressor-like RCC1 family protein